MKHVMTVNNSGPLHKSTWEELYRARADILEARAEISNGLISRDYEDFLLQVIEGLAEELEKETSWSGLRVL